MKINILRAIFIILLLSTFFLIFEFSSQDSEKSGSLSQKITEEIAKKIPSIQKKEPSLKQKIINIMENVIRKIAHFSIYTVVGILLMSLLSTYKIKEKNRILISIIIGIIYASSDEIHQAFVPGRGPQITDVFIDAMGVILGILLVLLILKIYQKMKYLQNEDKSLNW